MIRRILAGLAALLIVLIGGAWLYLLSSLPQVEGRLVLAGPKTEIRIERDRDGVPLIIAADDDDAAFGLGFVHAQERLFQMELQRRYAAGRLAEIFGPEAVATDRQMRVFGLYRAAEAEIAYLSPEVKRAFAAYAAGVNAFLASRRGALPPEFLLLRFRPEPWRVADSLLWGKLMALRLEGNYRGELLRARLARTVPAGGPRIPLPGIPEGRADDPGGNAGRSIAGSGSTASTGHCRRRSGRSTPRTTGSSTAPTARAASPFSPTTRISTSARRGTGIWPGSGRPSARSPARPRPASRSS